MRKDAPVGSGPDAAAGDGRRTPLILWSVAGVLAVAVIVAAVIKAWPLLNPNISERAPLNAECDLVAGPCRVRFAAGGAVTLDILPRGVPPLHPLTIEASLAGLPAPQRVEVDFAGVDMDMGYNRVALQPDARAASVAASESGNGRALPGTDWSGAGMLPVCVRQRMTWEARVLLFYPQRILAAPFQFDTLRPENR